MKSGGKFISITLLVLNMAVVVLLVSSYFAILINPGDLWIFAFLGLAYPIFLLGNLFFVFLWLILWKRYVLLSFVAILLGWHNLRAIYPFRLKTKEYVTGTQVKVVSYNVHRLYGKDISKKNGETRSKVTEFLATQKADILFIQEFFATGSDPGQILDKFMASLNLGHCYYMNYSGRQFKKKINAIALFSKYPIIDSGYFKLQDGSLFAVFADIVVNKDTIRLYNLHLESIRFASEDYTFYSHLTEPDNEIETVPLREGSKKMFWKLRKAFIIRSSQVQILTRHIASCKYPIILGGDFNDTPSSYTYHQLTKSLNDAFIESGKGFFESTYAGKFPSFRIDYILHSPQIQSVQYQKHNIALSDHFPVTTTLVLNSKNK